MERIAIISDIHGNITALEAVLNDIKSKNIRRIFCLGDLVIKGPNPDIVIDIVKEKCEVVIKGNCDETIAKPQAFEKAFWSRIKIGEERAKYLKDLPVSYEFYLSGHLVRLFHASPFGLDEICNPTYSDVNNKYSKIKSPLDLFQNTEFIGKTVSDKMPDIIGYGHIHTPNTFRFKNKLIFNTGSVGFSTEMLNNGDEEDKTNNFSTLASYSILEGEYNSRNLASISVSNVRVFYDVSKEIKLLENSNMPGKERMIFTLKTASNNYTKRSNN